MVTNIKMVASKVVEEVLGFLIYLKMMKREQVRELCYLTLGNKMEKEDLRGGRENNVITKRTD